MQNLYEVITSLVEKKSVLNAKAQELMTAVDFGDVSASDEYDYVATQIVQIESELTNIEKKYAVGVVEMAKIISDATGKHYVPKIFREVTNKNGKISCTHVFATCFVSEENMYYQDQNKEIVLIESGYHKLIDDIDNRNGVIQFSGSEMFETEQLNIRKIYKSTNFIKMFTQPKVHTEVNKVFEKKIKPLLIKYLQSIKVDSVDGNLGHGR